MGDSLKALKARLAEITNIQKATAVLAWDQATYMPPGGAPARAAQLSTLGHIAHARFVADEVGELLQRAQAEVEGLPDESDDVCLVRVTQRDYDQARRLPSSFVAEVYRHGAEAYEAWTRARQNNDFVSFAPYLQKTVEYSRQRAEYLGYERELYDALLDEYEPGMSTAQVKSIFDVLRAELVPLVHAIAEKADTVDDSMLHGSFDIADQEKFGMMVIRAFGFDFNRGRQDITVHPFAISFSPNDVRLTTRFSSAYAGDGLFSTLHESGHGMYEQGIDGKLEGTPLAGAASLGLHESQSRLWENVVGRSRGFWGHYYPLLQRSFPQLKDIDLETFYRAVNKVEPSLIRVDADEVTYNLHIMLRLEMELALLSGDLAVKDAPEAWNHKMADYLGITPRDDTSGVLQDVHWSHGTMGYFTTYSLGNLLSIQFYDAAVKAVPEIPDQIGRGEFANLHGWLTDHVYRHGRKFEPNELVQRATGEPIQSRSYVAYLKSKFSDIYGLS